jgi:uncharacterized protein (DUF2236 family)
MLGSVLPSPLPLLPPLRRRIDEIARGLLEPDGAAAVDFATPEGEPALIPPNSVSWRIFKNPISLFIGGVAAVLLELAEPRVRTGVWEHSSFRSDPVQRLRRTGLAAMTSVYGPRSVAEAMIERVRRVHERVIGITPAGEPYRANDVELLSWVHATAGFGFSRAYSRFVRPLSETDRARLFRESAPSSQLYGALTAPASVAERHALFAAMAPRLERSSIIFEFLDIMQDAPVFPAPLAPLQRVLLRAAVEVLPGWARERLDLGAAHGLRPWEAPFVRRAGKVADRVMVRSSPAVQSCLRLGLPADYLYRR